MSGRRCNRNRGRRRLEVEGDLVGPHGDTLVSTDQSELRSSAGYFFSKLNEKTTSAALKGFPSVQVTPLRIVKVRVLLPLFHAHAVASHGVTAPPLIESTYASSS